jgi:hypothetical protein
MFAAVLVGCVGGLATGGRLGNIVHQRFKAWPLVAIALVAQAFLGHLAPQVRWVAATADCAAIAAWCIENRQRRLFSPGPDLLALGVTLNAAVIAANAGMPVSPAALARAGLPASMDVSRGHLYKHVVMTGHSHLRALGDIFALPHLHTVVSAGDVVMLAGIALVVWSATHVEERLPTRGFRDALAGRDPAYPALDNP